MTEDEWFAATHTGSLLRAASQLSSERKVRLFACACARQLFPPDAHPDLQRWIEIAEQMADGIASRASIESASELFGSLEYVRNYEARGLVGENTFIASLVKESLKPRADRGAKGVIARLSDYEADLGLENPQCGLPLLVDIFGNPFCPVAFDPEWRNSTVVLLARQMYESRDFSPMPILADALEDADCDNTDILTHCRNEGPHVRGCWVVDKLLGKE